jgi:hypothetical protein
MLRESKPAAFALLILIALAIALPAASGLRFAPVKDEVYFLEATHHFSQHFSPSIEQLQSYSVMQTPLAFLVWALLGRLTGDALFSGRLLNLVLVVAMLSLVALRRGDRGDQRLLAAVGLVAYPYLLGIGVHLYTDVPAAFLALAGTWAHLRGRRAVGFVLFALAIATRQYMVAIPAAIAAWEWTGSLRGERSGWLRGGVAALAAATLLGWFAVFGGLAPHPGEDRWIPGYPAPMLHAGVFMLDYGLYFLAGLGAYFVVPELLLFRDRRRWRSVATLTHAALAVGLLVLFMISPPKDGGVLYRAVRLVIPNGVADGPRMAIFYGLALLAVVRFARRLDLAFWIVAINFLLMLKTQLPWDKYYLPVIAVLWFLKAEGMLEDGVFLRRRRLVFRGPSFTGAEDLLGTSPWRPNLPSEGHSASM